MKNYLDTPADEELIKLIKEKETELILTEEEENTFENIEEFFAE
jgi:hypothetical protein